MDLFEAQQIARKIRAIPNVQVLGVKTIKGEKALVISIDRTGKKAILEADRAVARVAKAAGVMGHFWERLDVCSLCYYDLKDPADGHYHSVRKYGGAVEGVCCSCVTKSGAQCSILASREKAKRDAKRARWNALTREQKQAIRAKLEARKAEKRKAKRTR